MSRDTMALSLALSAEANRPPALRDGAITRTTGHCADGSCIVNMHRCESLQKRQSSDTESRNAVGDTYEGVGIVGKVEVGTVFCLLDTQHTDGASRVAVLDAGMAFRSMSARYLMEFQTLLSHP